MKKILSFICALVFLLTMVSCNTNSNSDNNENKEPALILPSYCYDFDEFQDYWQLPRLMLRDEEIRKDKPLSELHSEFPVQGIVVLNEAKIAAVYRLQHEDHCIYAYVIFDAPADEASANRYQNWININQEIYYVSEIRASGDFESLSVGDHISKAVALDVSIACAYREYKDTSSGQFLAFKVAEWCDYRLLKDGVMCITFQAPFAGIHDVDVTDERFTITAIDFYPYGSTDVPDYISVINCPNILQDN